MAEVSASLLHLLCYAGEVFQAGSHHHSTDIFCTKCDLLVTRDNAVKCEPGEYFICDLIGLRVITDEGEELGNLTDVIETGANNVYEVTSDTGKIYYLPVIDQCILSHDMTNRTVTVHILKGLLDIN